MAEKCVRNNMLIKQSACDALNFKGCLPGSHAGKEGLKASRDVPLGFPLALLQSNVLIDCGSCFSAADTLQTSRESWQPKRH